MVISGVHGGPRRFSVSLQTSDMDARELDIITEDGAAVGRNRIREDLPIYDHLSVTHI